MTVRRTLTVLVALTLVTPLGCIQYWALTGRVAAVEPGRLYRSAALPTSQLLEVCRRHGITTVVDFRDEPERVRAEGRTLARAGIRHVALPTGQVPSEETVADFLRVMDGARHEAVLIHCTHGSGRTGLFSAVYRIEYQGWPRWRAIAEEMVLGGVRSFAPGSAKARFLRGYMPRTARPAGSR